MTQARPTDLGSGAMFDRIAGRYDMLNRVLSGGVDQRWRRRTVEVLGLGEGASVLDLATGTADLAILIAQTHTDCRVTGLDPSENMLAIGRDKINELELADRVELVQGDAQALPFEDNTFDAVSIAFGIRNVPNRSMALSEMARVTKPGGRVAVLELNEPARGWLSPFARFHIRHVVPTVGALISGSREYRYLQQSIEAFPEPHAFAEMMKDAAIGLTAIERFTFGVCCLYVGQVRR